MLTQTRSNLHYNILLYSTVNIYFMFIFGLNEDRNFKKEKCFFP